MHTEVTFILNFFCLLTGKADSKDFVTVEQWQLHKKGTSGCFLKPSPKHEKYSLGIQPVVLLFSNKSYTELMSLCFSIDAKNIWETSRI